MVPAAAVIVSPTSTLIVIGGGVCVWEWAECSSWAISRWASTSPIIPRIIGPSSSGRPGWHFASMSSRFRFAPATSAQALSSFVTSIPIV
jgi:hypothetical protein